MSIVDQHHRGQCQITIYDDFFCTPEEVNAILHRTWQQVYATQRRQTERFSSENSCENSQHTPLKASRIVNEASFLLPQDKGTCCT